MPELCRLEVRYNLQSPQHLYVILLRTERLSRTRDEFLDALQRENIGVGVHFRALHLHPYYRDRFGFKPGQLPAAEYASDRLLSLPLYPGMDDRAVEDTIAAVRKVVHRSRPVRARGA